MCSSVKSRKAPEVDVFSCNGATVVGCVEVAGSGLLMRFREQNESHQLLSRNIMIRPGSAQRMSNGLKAAVPGITEVSHPKKVLRALISMVCFP